ncbi:MAG: nucleotidyltransferase domain-containing protein [Planctomycetes bacterium]|nr:nucleotidyltransferase domain-containing protein [Planctomycetota bacterium]
MDKKAALKALRRFRRALEAQGVRVSQMVLFGSLAAGTAREDSDIDVVVVSRDFAGKGFGERLEILTDAVCAVHEPIDAVAMTPREWSSSDSMVADYAREGITVQP